MKNIELKIEGMSCEGCENRIVNALKEIDGVENVIANHKKKIVQVSLKKEIIDEIISTLEELDFKVMGKINK